MNRARGGIAVIALVLLQAVPVWAQADSLEAHSPWHVGGSIGLPRFGGQFAPWELFTLGFHASNAQPDNVGLDFAAGILPRAIPEGALALGIRLGGTSQIGQGQVRFWPSLGLSLASVVGSGGGGSVGGVYVGAATSFVGDGSLSGLRMGATLHRLNDIGPWLWLFEVGFLSHQRPRYDVSIAHPRVPPNLRLLLSRFALAGKERSPCSERSRATSIAAQQNR